MPKKNKTRSLNSRSKKGSSPYSSQSLGALLRKRKSKRAATRVMLSNSLPTPPTTKFPIRNPVSGPVSGFIHFGCWNRFDVDSGFHKVMPKLNEFIEDHKQSTDFVLVAGDNYYPEKLKDKTKEKVKDKTKEPGQEKVKDKGQEKVKDKDKDKTKDKDDENKRKIIHADLLKSGFASLPKTVDLHIILGNHDVETGAQMFVPANPDSAQGQEPEPAEACLIAELERANVNNDNMMMHVYKTFMWKRDTAIVMFDTTIYDLLDMDTSKKTDSVECYRPFLNANETATAISAKEIVDAQETHILQFLKKNKSEIKNVVLVGHYPIVSVKGKIDKTGKSGETTNKIECLLFSGFLEKIHGVFTRQMPKYHYLCADVHMYQRGTVTIAFPNESNRPMTIEQYVVGTGGAALDDLPDTSKPIECVGPTISPTNNIPIEYSISEAQKANGFLHCVHKQPVNGQSPDHDHDHGSTLSFEFIVSSAPAY